MLEYYKIISNIFFMGAHYPEIPLQQDYYEIKAAADRRVAARIAREETEQQDQKDKKIIENVLMGGEVIAAQVGKIVEGEVPGENIFFPEVILDENTQIVIPSYLQKTDLYVTVLSGRKSLFLSEITEAMIKNLSGIDIKIITEDGEEALITQMYARMNINGVMLTLGDYILSPHKKLQEMTA